MRSQPRAATIGAMTAQTEPIWHALTVDEVMAAQGVDARGRPVDERGREPARTPRTRTSSTAAAVEPRWQAFLRQYRDLMQIVLLVAGVVSLFLPHQLETAIVLIAITLLNAAMGLNQEGKASASVAALRKMMVAKARVRRGGELVVIPMEDVVAGDIISDRGGRSRPGRWSHRDRRDARDRRVGADRRERTGARSRPPPSPPMRRSVTAWTWPS